MPRMHPLSSGQADGAIRAFWGRWCGLDLYGCDLNRISDRQAIYTYIVELCRLLSFSRFGEPTIVRFGARPEIAGYSFTQLIETSLVSGHLVEASGCAFIDIFSCSQYCVDTARRFTVGHFSAAECVARSIDRGAVYLQESDVTTEVPAEPK